LHFTSPHFTSLHFDTLHFTFTRFSPHVYYLHFTPFIIAFLTIFLKVLGLHGKVPNTSAGSWFQIFMVLFTKEYFPISVLCFLCLIFRTSNAGQFAGVTTEHSGRKRSVLSDHFLFLMCHCVSKWTPSTTVCSDKQEPLSARNVILSSVDGLWRTTNGVAKAREQTMNCDCSARIRKLQSIHSD
jgi:hypothetical protein